MFTHVQINYYLVVASINYNYNKKKILSYTI